jgi:hypothetical protein
VYEIGTFQALREQLRCTEIWVAGADKWRNPDQDLLHDFQAHRDAHYAALRKPLELAAPIDRLRTEMRDELAALDTGLPQDRRTGRQLRRDRQAARRPGERPRRRRRSPVPSARPAPAALRAPGWPAECGASRRVAGSQVSTRKRSTPRPVRLESSTPELRRQAVVLCPPAVDLGSYAQPPRYMRPLSSRLRPIDLQLLDELLPRCTRESQRGSSRVLGISN